MGMQQVISKVPILLSGALAAFNKEHNGMD